MRALSLLDTAMPAWDHRERHHRRSIAPPRALLGAAEEVTWREAPVFAAVMAIVLGGRRVDPAARIIDTFLSGPYSLLGVTTNEVLVGGLLATPGAGRRPPTGLDGDQFRAYERPGAVKVAVAFTATAGGIGTETRVRATDARSRRLFDVYWLVIRLPSGGIRRVWLRAVEKRAREHAGV